MGAVKREGNHIQEIRIKILNSAKELLAEEGYRKTTMRKIVERSGVLTGSIYYLFKNKEEIFKSMLLELTKDCQRAIKSRCGSESPLFQYAAVCEVELRVLAEYPIIRDTYRDGYCSGLIFEGMVEQFVNLARDLFQGTVHECSDEDYYANTLLIKGGMYACLTELYFKQKIRFANSRKHLQQMALILFGASEAETADILQHIDEKESLWLDIGNDLVKQPFR